MKIGSLASPFAVVVVVACGGTVGCGGSLDSSGLGADTGSMSDGAIGVDAADASVDTTTTSDTGATDSTTSDGSPGETSAKDATTTDSTGADVVAIDSTGADVVAIDSTGADVVAIDSTGADVVAIDSTGADVVAIDSTGADVVAIDSTSADVVAIDSTGADVVAIDSTGEDVIAIDSGSMDAGGVTLLNVCTQFADAICGAQLQSCCSAHSVAFATSGCQTNALFLCNSWVDRVNAGTSTFDPTAFSACVAGWQAAEAKCDVPNLDFAQDYAPCDQLFNGKVSPGAACTADGDCNAAPGSFVACETVGSAKQCVQNTFPTVGGACTFTGTPRAICVDGDYCPSFGATGIGAKCAVATPIGSACANALDAACGVGNHCAPGASPLSFVCARGLGAGATCTSFADCASLTCTSGACTDPDAHLASADLCGG